MANVINPNKGRVYFAKDGLVLDSANLDKYHPNSNVDTLQVNIEDGGSLNAMALINYQSPNMEQNNQATTSHWYPLFFIGMNNVKVANESAKRSFAQYLTSVPPNILNLNLGKKIPMNIKATVKIVGGINFVGVYDSLVNLQLEYPASQELDENYSIAGIIDEVGNVDFYQVEEIESEVYAWIIENETTNPLLSLLESKQYNISNISVQGGLGNATPLPLATQHYQILWQSINNLSIMFNAYDDKVDNVISLYQNTIQSVLETNTIKPTITTNLPNGKNLELDVKVSANNDIIEVETDGLKVTNEKVDERIDLKTDLIIQDIDDMVNGDKKFNVVGYNVAYGGTLEIGETAWNDTFKCLETRVSDNVVIQHGQEQLQYVRASTNILNGQAVYVSGSTGQRLNVGVANNNIKEQAQSTIAVATENFTLVGADQFGFICNYGLVNGIKTDYATWVTGQPLYLETNGVLTNVIPSGTAYIVRVGIVGRVHGVDGSIMVAPMYMPTMGELSQVDDVTPQTDDILIRDSNGVWKNSQRLKVVETTYAKLAVSNVFTQPQQVPNATLPQHTTNLSQVETMFEMFKQQLRGYNLAMPDLTGKPEISPGIYRFSNSNGLTLDYNVNTGIFEINGSSTSVFAIIISGIYNITQYIATYIYVSGTTTGNTQSLFFADNSLGNQILLIPNTENIITQQSSSPTSPLVNNSYVYLYISQVGRVFTNYQFKLQLEKGSTATPYTVAGQIPQYKIVGES